LITYKETLIPGKPDKAEKFPKDEEVENRLVIIALVGIKDPLRDGIKEAVLKCNNAGINVRMVTGDIWIQPSRFQKKQEYYHKITFIITIHSP